MGFVRRMWSQIDSQPGPTHIARDKSIFEDKTPRYSVSGVSSKSAGLMEFQTLMKSSFLSLYFSYNSRHFASCIRGTLFLVPGPQSF